VSSVPALVILAQFNDPTRALVLSQVVLSFGLPFALVPLIAFTAKREVMGAFVNRGRTTVVASLIAVVVLSLNAFVLTSLFASG
jgi:manganese transport protein